MISEKVPTFGEFVVGRVVNEYLEHPTNNATIKNLFSLLNTYKNEVLSEYLSVLENHSKRTKYSNLENVLRIELKSRTKKG